MGGLASLLRKIFMSQQNLGVYSIDFVGYTELLSAKGMEKEAVCLKYMLDQVPNTWTLVGYIEESRKSVGMFLNPALVQIKVPLAVPMSYCTPLKATPAPEGMDNVEPACECTECCPPAPTKTLNHGANKPADPVNHPPHYTQGEVETIDFIMGVTAGLPGKEAPLVANILKYVSRYKLKNGVEDLKKAKVYLDWLINTVETGNHRVVRAD